MHDLTSKIEPLIVEFNSLESELTNPEAAQKEDFIQRSQRFSYLRDVLELDRKLNQAAARIAEAEDMLADSDPDLRALAESELAENQQRFQVLHEQLHEQLLPRNPQDEQNAIIEIRSGTGGDEAALFAGDLTRMYQKYAEGQNWKIDFVDGNPTDLGGFKDVTFIVQGRGAFGDFKFESGVHRVQRVPKTESSGRVHTSTATVAVLPEAEDIEIEIKPDDIRVDVFRASGPGGQSVNTTDSAVRITHLPTGITVSCQDQKSQHKNKAKAMRVLQSRLQQAHQEEQHEEIAQQRRIQIGSASRSEKIRTYNFPQNRITDHRVDLTTHRFDQILKEGELQLLISPLRKAYIEDQLDAV